MSKKKKQTAKRAGSVWMAIGAVLLIGAVSLTGYNIYDENRAEQASEEVLDVIEQQIADEDSAVADAGEALPEYLLHPQMEMPTMEVDGISYIGTLEVPIYDLSLPVVAEWSYPNLKKAPCRYSGSAYLNNLVLAGHNYKSHFSNIKLLTSGDEIIFTDVEGNRFVYQVAEQEVLDPTAVEEMKTGNWDLTLFTCNYSGQMRVAVRCVLTESYKGSAGTI